MVTTPVLHPPKYAVATFRAMCNWTPTSSGLASPNGFNYDCTPSARNKPAIKVA
ncbi:hypothetical protein BMETH_1870_1 [methanotrophic bacterial endosymbiont of Bathymodiolus sp.]|nr:hypothetical protein BMETH_1870_1 [methanotrophic bacterial endosymbiont of Bathymodiolus sp.]